MSFSASFSVLHCPSCGQPIMPSGMTFGKEPDHLATKCEYCRKMIEMKRDKNTGRMVAEVTKPS